MLDRTGCAAQCVLMQCRNGRRERGGGDFLDSLTRGNCSGGEGRGGLSGVRERVRLAAEEWRPGADSEEAEAAAPLGL